jgi:hypothetical protein
MESRGNLVRFGRVHHLAIAESYVCVKHGQNLYQKKITFGAQIFGVGALWRTPTSPVTSSNEL